MELDDWIKYWSFNVTRPARSQLEALVNISTPFGDRGEEMRMRAAIGQLLGDGFEIQAHPSSSGADCSDDLVVDIEGTGHGRLLLLGHLDTAISHTDHQPLQDVDGNWLGSAVVDMKGGVVIAIGVLQALVGRPELYERITLLLVSDEEGRMTGFQPIHRYAGYQACLCFEAGEACQDGALGVVVERKAASTLRIELTGLDAHAGVEPQAANTLAAGVELTQLLVGLSDPDGANQLSVVPTVFHAGSALNTIPGHTEILCDMRSHDAADFDAVAAATRLLAARLPVAVTVDHLRVWPHMNTRDTTALLLNKAGWMMGRSLIACSRGGASDASYFAASIPLTIDGLGPVGGREHSREEYVEPESFQERAELALAVALVTLGEL